MHAICSTTVNGFPYVGLFVIIPISIILALFPSLRSPAIVSTARDRGFVMSIIILIRSIHGKKKFTNKH